MSKRADGWVPVSRQRAVVADTCACLAQQMIFWGCDARHPAGNLLVRFGMERVRCSEAESREGSSIYRVAVNGGTIELHSFLVAWRPERGDGWLYIRNKSRWFRLPAGEALTPGHYDRARITPAAVGSVRDALAGLFSWIVEYEDWVVRTQPASYRGHCWSQQVRRMGGRPWLPPDAARDWMRAFSASPMTVARARDQLRRPRKQAESDPLFRRNLSFRSV